MALKEMLKTLKGSTLLEEYKATHNNFVKIKQGIIKSLASMKKGEMEVYEELKNEVEEIEAELRERLNLFDAMIAGDGEGEFGNLTTIKLMKWYDEQIATIAVLESLEHPKTKKDLKTAQEQSAKLYPEIIRRMIRREK